MGWGAHLGQEVISSRWSPEEASLSINAKELLAVERGLLHFQTQVSGYTLAVFADNSTAVAYLRKSGHSLDDSELCCSADSPVGGGSPHCSSPSVHHGKNNVLADALSRPNNNGDPSVCSSWCFRSSARGGRCWSISSPPRQITTVLFISPFHDPQALGTDAFLHSWDGLLVYAFPRWALIPQVLKKLHSSSGVLMTLITPYWPQGPWFPDLLDLMVDRPVALPSCPDLRRQPHFHRRHLGIHRLSLHAWRLQ